jgi:hypothetical protein
MGKLLAVSGRVATISAPGGIFNRRGVCRAMVLNSFKSAAGMTLQRQRWQGDNADRSAQPAEEHK